MLIKRFEKKENGVAEIEWILSLDQQVLLINYAVESLLMTGLIKFADLSSEDFEKHNSSMQQELIKKYLEQLEPDEIPKA